MERHIPVGLVEIVSNWKNRLLKSLSWMTREFQEAPIDKIVVRSGPFKNWFFYLSFIFINDITCSRNVSSGVYLCLFADNTMSAFRISNKCRNSLEVHFFYWTSKLLQWIFDNLFVNTNKTHIIDFRLRNPFGVFCESSLLFEYIEVLSSRQTNFLDLLVDSNLNFSSHLDKVHSNLKVRLGFFQT